MRTLVFSDWSNSIIILKNKFDYIIFWSSIIFLDDLREEHSFEKNEH